MYIIFMWLLDIGCAITGTIMLIIAAFVTGLKWRAINDVALVALLIPSMIILAISASGFGWWLFFNGEASALPINVPVIVLLCLLSGAGVVIPIRQTPSSERLDFIAIVVLLLIAGFFFAAIGWNILFTDPVVHAVCDPHPGNCG